MTKFILKLHQQPLVKSINIFFEGFKMNAVFCSKFYQLHVSFGYQMTRIIAKVLIGILIISVSAAKFELQSEYEETLEDLSYHDIATSKVKRNTETGETQAEIIDLLSK